MFSTVSLELTNFINPELTWKTVTKGSRSASRRSRKPVKSLNAGVEQDDKSTKLEESSVSESEKLGVAVLGRHFADKIEHVPIKKRRFLVRSPSPPPRTPSPRCEESLTSQPQMSSPQAEDFDQTIDSNCASGQWCFYDSVSNREIGASNDPVVVQYSQSIENASVNGKLSDVSNGLGYTEDFSGIALLAAAACNNSVGDDVHNIKEGPILDEFLTPEETDSSTSATFLERTTTSSETGNLFPKDSAQEDSIDGSMIQGYSPAVSLNFHDKRDEETGKRSSSMKDDRLHWDLNTVMEAWELPCDDIDIGSQRNGLEDIPDDVVHCEMQEKLEGCVRHGDPEHALELLKYSNADTVVSIQVISNDESLDNSPFPGSDLILSGPLSDEKINTSPTNVVIGTRDDCCGSSAMPLSQTAYIENVHLGKHDVLLLDPAVSVKIVCEIDSIQSKEDSRKTFDLPDNGTSPTELVSTTSYQTSDVDEYSVSKSSPSHPSPEHGNLSALGTAFEEGQPVVAVDVEKKDDKEAPAADATPLDSPEHGNLSALGTAVQEGQPVVAVDVEKKDDKEAPVADATPLDSSLHVELKELMPKSYECFGKVALEYPIDDGYDSVVSHGHMDGADKLTEIQAGYESPFEDGELRESVLYSWEENEVEGVTEFVGCGSDNRDTDDFDAANHCLSEVGSDSCQNDNNGSLAEKVMQCGIANALKESRHSVSLKKFSGLDQLPEGCECSANSTGEAIISTQNILASDPMHGLDGKYSSTGEFGSRATRGKLLSHIEGPSSSDALHRKDNINMQQGGSNYDSCFQAGRVFGSKKYFGRDRPALRMQDGSQGDVHWVDSPADYWDSRNHYQSGYPQGTGHPRPRNVNANSATKIDGLTYHDQRRSVNYSSKSVYRPLIRRRSSPVDSDDVYRLPRRMVTVRDNGHTRSRGRSGIYRHEVGRGPREFHGPMSDDPASSSVHLPHYLARRERSFSPVFSKGSSFSRPCRKSRSRSRSRSRSPLPWHLQRERNMGVRRLSRSPDFRPKARMERIRMPFQKSNFASDDEDVYMSPPRSRFSPQPHSRWIDDRNCEAARFRERNLRGRLFGRSQRFDSRGSPGRMKSDDCFRSMIRPGRFTELSGGAGRGHKYDGSDGERTKYHDKYEMVHRVGRCDTGGVVRRFRNDAEDCFEMHNTHNEDVRRGDIPRNRIAREERVPFRYNKERVYATGPKLSGIRDYDEDGSSPRRG